MNSNFNNSLSISQHIYIQSLTNSNQLIHGQEGSKYSEYDLVDMFLSRNTLSSFELVTISDQMTRLCHI